MGKFLNLPTRDSRDKDLEILKKIRTSKVVNGVTVHTSGSNGIAERISLIRKTLDKNFPNKDNYALLNTQEDVGRYIDKIISEGICSVDTETDSLDPITCKMAGSSLYTLGQKSIYIPVNHLNYVTMLPIKDQITPEFLNEQYQRIVDKNVNIIFHNAKFDVRVIKNQIGVNFKNNIYWDTLIAAHLLNENESHALKYLWNKYCNKNGEQHESYGSLFDNLPFTFVPTEVGYLYAANDTLITWDLYEFQKQFLDLSSPKCAEKGLDKIASLYREIEIPLIPVLVDMEERGVTIDKDCAESLSVEYTNQYNIALQEFAQECALYQDKIDSYKLKTVNHGLDSPVNAGSPKQIAILLYDILGLKCGNKQKPRSTAEEDLEALDHPVASKIVRCRKIKKLLSTYIDNLPTMVKEKTNKLHGSFNQTGTKTGRLSSSEPNLQNIPSKDKKIRKMFSASTGCYLVSSDLKQQEPKILADLADDKILKSVGSDDIYAFAGSIQYKLPIDECREKLNGVVMPKGKERRDKMKGVVLGLMYGKGTEAVAKDFKISVKEAQKFIDTFFDSFPAVKVWVDNLLAKASQTGYVETVCGRKRRLPDLTLPKYEFSYIEGKSKDFDPTFDDEEDIAYSSEVPDEVIDEYWDALERADFWRKRTIKEKAEAEGILIRENSKKISDAVRQALNSPIQGSAGDMVKKIMVCIGNIFYQENVAQVTKGYFYDEEICNLAKDFKELGGRLLIQVHDELLYEGPKENILRIVDIVERIMIKAASYIISIPMAVDTEVSDRWYGENILPKLREEANV